MVAKEIPLEIAKLAEQYDRSKENEVTLLLKRNTYGNVKNSLSNLETIILSEPYAKGITFNEFTQEVLIEGEPMEDYFINEIRVSVDKKFDVKFSKEDILSVLSVMARKRGFHPVKEMIESQPWDGIKRAETIFIDYLGAEDNDYIRAVSRKWLAGGIARIYHPSIKMEIVPVLQGKQGAGKSTLAAKLGGNYFTDSLSTLGESKDDYQQLIGAWIIELGELSSFKKTDADKIKNFISARSDKIRLPYQRITQEFKRTCIFIGTTNNDRFLNDLTGNRRFFPIPLKEEPSKSVFELEEATIQQIWAEAKIIHDSGEELYLNVYEEAIANEYRKESSKEELFYEDLEDFLEMPVPPNWENMKLYDKRNYFYRHIHENYTDAQAVKLDKTTAKELTRVVFNLDGSGSGSSGVMNKINLYMANHERWKKQSVWINGKAQKGFKRVR